MIVPLIMISFFRDIKIKRSVYVLCCICSLSSLLHGQIKFTHYKVEDGLPHDFTFQVYQDDQGYLWIGTDDGLAKFNGSTFKVFDRTDGFASNFIIDINKYKADTLAVAVWKGGLHFIKGDSIIVPKIIKNESDLSNIHSIYPFGDDIFASFYERHIFYERQENMTFKRYEFRITKDKKNRFVLREKHIKRGEHFYSTIRLVNNILCFYGGIHSKNKTRTINGVYEYTSKEKIKPVFPFLKNKIINELGAYNHNLFYATEIDSFFVFNKHRIISRKKLPFKNNIIHKYVQTSYCEVFGVKDNKSGNDIIHLYDKKNNIWINISETYKIGDGIMLSDILVDRDENIWITSKADGLYKLTKEYRDISETLKYNSHIIDIAIGENDKVFFLTLKSIYGYDYKLKKTQIRFLQGKALGFYDVASSKDSIVIFYSGEPFEEFSFFDNEFRRMNSGGLRKDENDHTFFFNQSSFTYVDSTRISKNVNIYDVKRTTINDITKIGNEIWVATNFGVIIYNAQSLEYKKVISFDKTNSRSYVKKIIQDPTNKIWTVMSNKLVNMQDEECLIYYGEVDGLASDKINDIMLDHRGVLWIATQKGFSIFKNGMFYNFNQKDGLRSSFVSKIVEDKNNHQVWIGGNKGAIAIDNTKPFEPLTSPKFIIQHGKDRFDLDVIDYSGKTTITQYKTKPDDNWKNLNGNILDISNFGTNNYQTQFRVRNPLSNWSYSQKYSFVITPVWYKRTVFVVITSLIVALLITLLIYIRLQRVTERNSRLEAAIEQSATLEKELSTVRENVAQDFHDELGNKLAGISVLSELMMKKENEQSTKHFNSILRVQKDAKDLYFGIKDFIWSIDTKSDQLDELIVYLSDFGEELFANTKIVFRIEKNLDQSKTTLPYYWSRQLLLMFKEALTNALKHSEASEVILTFFLKKNSLKIICDDNGLGFDQNKIKRKNGLSNIQKRAKKLNGELIVISTQGTHISFTGEIS